MWRVIWCDRVFAVVIHHRATCLTHAMLTRNPPLYQRVETAHEFCLFLSDPDRRHPPGELGNLYIGIDPGGKNFGWCAISDAGCYMETTVDAHAASGDHRPVGDTMHSPVYCGEDMAALSGRLFATEVERLYCHPCIRRVYTVVEVVMEGPSNYWCAAIVAVLRSVIPSRGGPDSDLDWNPIFPVQPRTVKSNFCLASDGHDNNKRMAVTVVTRQFGMTVRSDHGADALLMALYIMCPRLKLIRVPGVRPNTTRKEEESLEAYVTRIYSNRDIQCPQPPISVTNKPSTTPSGVSKPSRVATAVPTTSSGSTSTPMRSRVSRPVAISRTSRSFGSLFSVAESELKQHAPTAPRTRTATQPPRWQALASSDRSPSCNNPASPTSPRSPLHESLVSRNQRRSRRPSSSPYKRS